MQLSKKARTIVTNLLMALAISLIVNIADMLIVMRKTASMSVGAAESEKVVMDTIKVGKRLYAVPAQNRSGRIARDSVMAQAHKIADSLIRAHLPDTLRRRLEHEIRATFPAARPEIPPLQKVDSSSMTNPGFVNRGPMRRDFRLRWAVAQSFPFQAGQMAYFFLLGFILISVATYEPRTRSGWNYPVKLAVCLSIAVMAYFLAPQVAWTGEIIPTLRLFGHGMYDPTLLLKCSLLFVVAALYGKIYELISQRQNIILENEKLKTENLQATYSSLINQMNPHFFFNSLNSLSMLVREKHNKEALTYIDHLSDTFRYILQNGSSGTITLAEELKFTDAYKYLLQIRYEGKLFINFRVDDSYSDWFLPSLSLQPLLENAVKHNTITMSEPLHIDIFTDGSGNVCVSNSVNPKIDKGEGTGIGLSNLSERYRLLTGKEITIIHNKNEFTAILPLTKPAL